MDIRRISNEEKFDAYVAEHPYGHYMKTARWGRFKKDTENDSYECLGFYEGDELKGTAMALREHQCGADYLYVPWGPCIDYTDRKLVKDTFEALKQYCDEKGVDFLRTDPNVVRVPHDIKGNVLMDFNNENTTLDIKSTGFKHKGYGYAYNGSFTNRFTLIVDLKPTEKEIFNNFQSSRRRAIRHHASWHVSTHTGDESNIKDLMYLEGQLTRQDGFKPHSYEFFNDLLQLFGDHARLYVTEIDLDAMMADTKKDLESSKYKKDPKAKEKVAENIEKAEKLKAEFGSHVVIACGLFIYWGNKSWDLYTYNHKAFGFIRPVDNLHYYAMCDMKKHGVTDYDMVGFSGETTPTDPNYGLYNYKSSFGPVYTEYIGEFDYIRDYKKRSEFNRRYSLHKHVQMKWWQIRYKNKKVY